LLPEDATPTRPSAAVRPAFLSAFAIPLARSQSTAASISPLVSASAALQSIMPAPVRSRSSLTRDAEMLMMSPFMKAKAHRMGVPTFNRRLVSGSRLASALHFRNHYPAPG